MRAKLLDSLCFPEMSLRYNNIAVAQKRTFNWIFSSSTNPASQTASSWTNFSSWLTSINTQGPRLYWISGKPGSGKSTLMRFVSDDKRTKSLSQQWSHGREVLIASCYFWNPGSVRQKSQEGLLQSLLYQLLTRQPTFPGSLFPTRWRLLDLGAECNYDWTTTELWNALFACIDFLTTHANVLLFIDGLDEFHGDDTQRQEVCDLLLGLAENHNVKICTSSRPWNIYREAFEEGFPMLRLEDLTRNDIQNYVEDEFRSHKLVQAWTTIEPGNSAAFYAALVERAQGVFLWIRLVVRSLLAGLQNRDDITDLSRRLEDIPPDLEDYFKRLMTTLDPFYLDQASQTFEIALRGPRLLMAFYFMHPKPLETGLNPKIPQLTLDDVLKLRDTEDRRINAQCMGLLETRELGGESAGSEIRYVNFLHRTARDFVASDYMQNLLNSWRKSTFDPDTALVLSLVPSLGSCDPKSPWMTPEVRRTTIDEVVEVARNITTFTNESFEMLEQLGQYISRMKLYAGVYDNITYKVGQFDFDFLAFCLSHRLNSFFLEKSRRSSQNPLDSPRRAPLLAYALREAERDDSTSLVLDQLFALGADVNETIKDVNHHASVTVWGKYLETLPMFKQQDYELVKRLVKEGPLEKVYIPKSERHHYDHEFRPKPRYIRTLDSGSVFRQIFPPEQARELVKLLNKSTSSSTSTKFSRLSTTLSSSRKGI